MKKVFAVMAIAGMFAFASCGPKAEEATTEGTENTENMEATATMEEAPATETAVDESAAMATDSTATMEAAPGEEGATEAAQ
jgi:hypothetical protein